MAVLINDILEREESSHREAYLKRQALSNHVNRRFGKPESNIYQDILRLWKVKVIKPEKGEIYRKLYGDLAGGL